MPRTAARPRGCDPRASVLLHRWCRAVLPQHTRGGSLWTGLARREVEPLESVSWLGTHWPAPAMPWLWPDEHWAVSGDAAHWPAPLPWHDLDWPYDAEEPGEAPME